MTFLEICRRIARESGTIPGANQPPSVVNQSGRLAKVVDWANDAWRDIQTYRRDWLWMEGDFEGVTLPDLDAYAPGGAEFQIDRFRQWKVDRRLGCDSGVTIYRTSDGVSDERPMPFVEWETYRRVYLRGETDTGYPGWFSIDPANAIRLHPVPDGAYTVRGRYLKSAQNLAADGDIPEMPEDFHMLIVWWALNQYLGVDDETTQIQFGGWGRNQSRILKELQFDQAPAIRLAGAMA